MAFSTLARRKEVFLRCARDDKVRAIVFFGESGIGKTWMAREMSYCAIREGFFNIAIWVSWDSQYAEEEISDHALLYCIARQLLLLSTTGESAIKDDREEKSEEKWKDLKKKISEAVARKRVLLVLDDVQKNEQQIISKLVNLLELEDKKSSYKVLVTTRKSIASNNSEDATRLEIEVEPLSEEDSLLLFQQRAGNAVYGLSVIKALAGKFVKKFRTLPGAIILMSKAFSYFGKSDSGVQMLERSLEEASDDEIYGIEHLLRIGYDLFSSLPYSVLIDCCRVGSHFFRDRGSIHYNELIAYWMMEGYLGHVDCIEKAYEVGHHVFMELIDCGILKKADTDYVTIEGARMNLDDLVKEGARKNLDDLVMEGVMINLDDCKRWRYGGTASLGLSTVFTNTKWEGFGRITQTDGTIKTLGSGKQGQKLSTLLLDGNSIGKEVPGSIFESEKELQVLAIFNPTLKMLPETTSKMDKLHVLLLRGCGFLEEIKLTRKLDCLTALEISGASSLKEIPELFFKNTPKLRSLNLSGLQMESLPSSLYDNLPDLNWLILRNCSELKKLKRLNRLKKLMVLDLSGSSSLEKLEDGSFSENGELQILNFSKTKITSLPFVDNLRKLTHLLLSGCQELVGLPRIRSVTTLQILDLSDASKFIEFRDKSLESLKILDLSGTAADDGSSDNQESPENEDHSALSCLEALGALEILNLSNSKVRTLPFLPKLVNLRQLLLSSCLYLKKLPDLNPLTKLEVLDLSGCTSLEEISFDHMSRLLKLDLSETKIKNLPSLSNLENLRHLLLKKCTHMTLPNLQSQSKLEELNLCGITSLEGNGADFLEHMSHLRILNLSETLLEQLPPGFVALTQLEVLDLSGTAISTLPNLQGFGNLRELVLRDCPCLQGFLKQNMLRLLGATVQEHPHGISESTATVEELPYGISKLTHLEHLDLQNVKKTQGADGRMITLTPEELNGCQWGISGLPSETVREGNRRPISVGSTQFLQLLKSTPPWWENSFQQFDFSIHPIQEQSQKGVIGFHRDHFVFRDIYFLSKHFSEFKGLLEIFGFNHAPKNIRDVLTRADFVVLVDNTFEKCLSDLGASNLEAMKGCWIERCTKMEFVFHPGKAEDVAKLVKNFEILGVLNAIKLTAICHIDVQYKVFQNLKYLFLDCCPNLSNVFSSSQLPENLEVLEIKFCDKLKSLFEEESPKPELLKLKTLLLWELPELTSIGCMLPSLQTLKVSGCPKLQKLEEDVKLAKSLQHLWISNATDLESIYNGNYQRESFVNLISLTIESCPMLVDVFSSSHPPQSLKSLKIKSCEKLKTLFEHGTSGGCTLQNLHTLHLHELPKLETIGAKLPSLKHPKLLTQSRGKNEEVSTDKI